MFALTRLLSVPNIFLFTKVNLTCTLLLSRGCFLLLGRHLTSLAGSTESGLFQFPGGFGEPLQVGPAAIISPRSSHHRGEHSWCSSRCPPTPTISSLCSGSFPSFSTRRQKLLLHLGFFSVAKNYHWKPCAFIYSYSFWKISRSLAW